MTQDEKWLVRFQEVVTFIEVNNRNPSRHRIEEHDFLNWLKANRKAMNAGRMKPERGWNDISTVWQWSRERIHVWGAGGTVRVSMRLI